VKWKDEYSKSKAYLLEQSPPKTLYEFERIWKELKAEPCLRNSFLLNKIGAKGITKIFSKGSLEGDLFLEIINALSIKINNQSEYIIDILESLTKIDSIEMTLMFMDVNDKLILKQFFNELFKQTNNNNRVENLVKFFT